MNTWTDKIDKTTQKFEEFLKTLDARELNWKVDENTWSIAQNLDHIIRVNQSYYPTFANIKQGIHKTPFIAKFGFAEAVFGKTIKLYTRADRKKRIKTFDIWEPGKGDFKEDIFVNFKDHQSELKEQIEELKPFITRGIAISSPASRYLVYTLGDTLDIITQHEERHYNQAREVFSVMQQTL